ncbi:MAG: gliding motility-associated C-terminal domain-containing protein, partial [Bacteroidetes bacterium]|nr:gliding motility-associated C-terminal domain-containing protein [Bacteroidota bacterium]
INLAIDSFVVQNIDTTICQGQTLSVNGVTYSNAGFYQDTAFYAASGCDSIQFVINLAIDSFVVQNIDTTICQGQTLSVNGMTYSNAGFYQDTAFYTASGCDSIQFVINLAIDSFVVQNIDTTICQGQTLSVNGVTYSNAGFYQDTAFYAASGCDSIQFVINLAIDSFEVQNIDTTICQGQSITVNGITYINEGFYQDTAFYTASGCDSIQFVINLVIDSFVVQNIDTTICQGQTLSVNGMSYSNAGFYQDTAFYTASGCDSIQFNITLNIDSITTFVVDTAICEGFSIIVHGQSYSATGLYFDTAYYALSGCVDTIFEINLLVNPLPNVLANVSPNDSLCQGDQLTLSGSGAQSYVWDNGIVDGQPASSILGQTDYIVIGTDQNSCVNRDTLRVFVFPTYSELVNAAICEDEFYTLPDGSQVNASGSYPVMLNSIFGCDSLITTNLVVNQIGIYNELEDLNICEGFSVDLDVNASNMVSFEWFVNDGSGSQSLLGNPNYLGANTGVLSFNLDTLLHQNMYSVNMVDECGNAYSSSMSLGVFTPHPVANPVADTTFCQHELSVITVDYNGFNYEWSNGEFGASILPEESGDYIVNFTENVTNCALSDTISISVEDCIGNCVVLAPTGFSPDGSGKNDIFRVVTTCDEGFSAFYFAVYNRWGELVYATDNWLDGWDGTYKGRDAEIATYTYYVEYTKNLSTTAEILRGNVTLIK